MKLNNRQITTIILLGLTAVLTFAAIILGIQINRNNAPTSSNADVSCSCVDGNTCPSGTTQGTGLCSLNQISCCGNISTGSLQCGAGAGETCRGSCLTGETELVGFSCSGGNICCVSHSSSSQSSSSFSSSNSCVPAGNCLTGAAGTCCSGSSPVNDSTCTAPFVRCKTSGGGGGGGGSSSSSGGGVGQIQCGLCGYTMTTQSQCDNIRNWSNAGACSCASKYDLRTEGYDPSKNVNCNGGGSSSSTSTGGGTLPFNKLCGEPCGVYAGGLCTGNSICRYINGPACSASGIGTYCLPINLPSGWTQANCVSRDQGNLYVLNSGQNPTVAQIQSICQITPNPTPLPNTGIEDGLGYLILGLVFILFGGSFYFEFLNKKKKI